jgi:hypothetical protein
MSSPSYTLSAQAYALPILHAALHPSSTCLGLFLGSSTEITEVVPLQHINTSLSPYTELGLELATTYAEGKGLKVLGMYIAHEAEAKGLGRVGERILAKVGGFGVVLNNERLEAGEGAFDVSSFHPSFVKREGIEWSVDRNVLVWRDRV